MLALLSTPLIFFCPHFVEMAEFFSFGALCYAVYNYVKSNESNYIVDTPILTGLRLSEKRPIGPYEQPLYSRKQFEETKGLQTKKVGTDCIIYGRYNDYSPDDTIDIVLTDTENQAINDDKSRISQYNELANEEYTKKYTENVTNKETTINKLDKQIKEYNKIISELTDQMVKYQKSGKFEEMKYSSNWIFDTTVKLDNYKYELAKCQRKLNSINDPIALPKRIEYNYSFPKTLYILNKPIAGNNENIKKLFPKNKACSIHGSFIQLDNRHYIKVNHVSQPHVFPTLFKEMKKVDGKLHGKKAIYGIVASGAILFGGLRLSYAYDMKNQKKYPYYTTYPSNCSFKQWLKMRYM